MGARAVPHKLARRRIRAGGRVAAAARR